MTDDLLTSRRLMRAFIQKQKDEGNERYFYDRVDDETYEGLAALPFTILRRNMSAQDMFEKITDHIQWKIVTKGAKTVSDTFINELTADLKKDTYTMEDITIARSIGSGVGKSEYKVWDGARIDRKNSRARIFSDLMSALTDVAENPAKSTSVNGYALHAVSFLQSAFSVSPLEKSRMTNLAQTSIDELREKLDKNYKMMGTDAWDHPAFSGKLSPTKAAYATDCVVNGGYADKEIERNLSQKFYDIMNGYYSQRSWDHEKAVARKNFERHCREEAQRRAGIEHARGICAYGAHL